MCRCHSALFFLEVEYQIGSSIVEKGHVIHIKASPNWYSSNFLGFAVSAVITKVRHGCPTYCNLDSHDPGSESVLSSRICSFTDDHMGKLEDTRDDHLWVAYIYHQFSASDLRNGVELSLHFMQVCGTATM